MRDIEKKLNITFNDFQNSNYEGVKNYIYTDKQESNRQKGRSTLGLILLIEKALENINRPFIIVDHAKIEHSATGINTDKYIIKKLETLLKNSKIKNKYTIQRDISGNLYTLTIYDTKINKVLKVVKNIINKVGKK